MLKNIYVNEFIWNLSLFANILSVFVFFTYLWPSPALNFQRNLFITKDDFSLLTNDYVTSKYIFVVLFPNLAFPLVVMTFLMRLMVIRFYGDFYNYKNMKNQQKENVEKFMLVLKWIHLGFTILSFVFFVISLIFLIIDFSDCNSINSKNNICSSISICCAEDILPSPPGITERCPFINSCNVDKFTTKDLLPDPYFLWIFIMTFVALGILIIHFILGYLGEFLTDYNLEEEGNNDDENSGENENDVDDLKNSDEELKEIRNNYSSNKTLNDGKKIQSKLTNVRVNDDLFNLFYNHKLE